LLDSYASHAVIAILREGNLTLLLKKDESSIDYIIGIGFKLLNQVPADHSQTATQTSGKKPERAPAPLAIPLGNYHGAVEFY